MAKATKKPFTKAAPKYEVGVFVNHLGHQRLVLKVIEKDMCWAYELKNCSTKDTYIIDEHQIK